MNEVSLNRIDFTQEQVDLVKRLVAPNANRDELSLFLYQCKRTGLDPLTRQIYCIHRGGKMTIQTSIDGFRVVAERSGCYAGQDEPLFTENEKGEIICCKVTVYKFAANGQRYPAAVGVAYWSEYAQQGPMWNKMKHTMISKCAEALALRKAFPQDLSGLYTTEEMQQADAPQTTEDANDLKVLDEAYQNETPNDIEKQMLKSMVYNTDMEEEERKTAWDIIDACNNYKTFDKIRIRLEERKLPFDQIKNPNQKDINEHLRKVI